jgi:DNA end-binding protein Ku
MPRFRLLHRKDLSPISMERVCEKDGKPVAWDDLVKGYEVERGQFVTVTEDDFKTAALERSRSIDILAFVPLEGIDVRYWDTPYLVYAAKGAEHSYALMAEALAKAGRAGISKYVMRQRQHLAALLSIEGRLMVSTMRFPEDLVALPDAPSRTKIPARELNLALQLIEGMADTWDPRKYSDDYVKALMRVIEAKAEGEVIRPAVSKVPAKTNVVDLVARLQESLAAAKARPGATVRARRSSTKSRRRAGARKSRAA